jgi:hypothetical protein
MTTPSSTTSQKHKAFSGEPMRDKPVEDLAGIGPVLASRLKEQGFNKVCYRRTFLINIHLYIIYHTLYNYCHILKICFRY